MSGLQNNVSLLVYGGYMFQKDFLKSYIFKNRIQIKLSLNHHREALNMGLGCLMLEVNDVNPYQIVC